MILAHLDPYNQIVGSDSSSIVRAIVDTSAKSGTYPPVVEGTSQFQAVGGVVIVEGLALTGTPGYNFSITFVTDGIDSTKPANKGTNTQGGQEMAMGVDLRECETGE